MREAERLGVVFNFYILPHQMPMLADMAARFPGVKIVVDHLGKPDLRKPDPWPEFRKMFELKRFPQVWISASEPYELSISGTFPYRDTIPFFKAVYEEFGGKKLIWGRDTPGLAGSCPWTRSWSSWNRSSLSTRRRTGRGYSGVTPWRSGDSRAYRATHDRIPRSSRVLEAGGEERLIPRRSAAGRWKSTGRRTSCPPFARGGQEARRVPARGEDLVSPKSMTISKN